MVISLKSIVKYIDEKIEKESGTHVSVIVPMVYHVRNDDRVILLDEEEFTYNVEDNKINFVCNYNGRTYDIYDDFYDFNGDLSNENDIRDYFNKYTRISYKDDLVLSLAIYYRFKED